MEFETVEGAFLKANLLYIDENYVSALESYDEAVELDTDKDWRIFDKRAACKLMMKDYDGCVKDCRESIKVNPKAVTSHYRMGLAHFYQGLYELCQKPFKNALENMSKEYEYLQKRIRRWLRKATAELRMRNESNLKTKEEREEEEKKEKEEEEKRKLEAIKIEEEERKKKEEEEKKKKEEEEGKEEVKEETKEPDDAKEESKEEEEEPKKEEEKEKKGEYDREEIELTEDWPSRYRTEEEKKEEEDGKSKIAKRIRYDHYQSDFIVTVNFYGLNKIPISDRKVECTGKKLIISFKLPDADETWERKIELYGEVKKHAVRNIKPKTEVTLHKMNPRNWPRLEKATSVDDEESVRKYPTNRPIDWDEIHKNTKVEEDSGVNSLFKQIYDSGDEETRKAMIKSLQESGGTVLSTNWKEVGKKTVKCSPPEGMERKRYDGYQYDGFMDSDSDSEDEDDFSRRGGKSYKWKK